MAIKEEFILAIDEGTTGTRAVILDRQGQVRSIAYEKIKCFYPQPQWVEQDPLQIWSAVEQTIGLACKQAKVGAQQIKAIGITNQRETVVVWDRKTGKPIYPAIVWQCRRTATESMRLRLYEKKIKSLTGLVVDPYFSATKIAWILDHVKGAREKAKRGELCAGTIDSWLIWKWTGQQAHVTDMTNASRTMLFDIHRREWSDLLLKIFNIPKSMLPTVKESGACFGETVKIRTLEGGQKIHAVMGDQQAALYGQGCFTQGSMKNTFGTGCFLLFNTGQQAVLSKKGLLTTLACDRRGKPVYALEGAVFMAGAIVQWLRDEMGFIASSKESEKIAKSLENNGGVYLVPAFVGLGAPYWDSQAKGMITGLSRGSNKAHMVRAGLEAIAYQTKDLVDLMRKETKIRLRSLSVDGGACQNDFLMQFVADMVNISIDRPRIIDSTVLGVAALAGLQSGLYQQATLQRLQKKERRFTVRMSSARREKLYEGWQDAVRRSLSHG